MALSDAGNRTRKGLHLANNAINFFKYAQRFRSGYESTLASFEELKREQVFQSLKAATERRLRNVEKAGRSANGSRCHDRVEDLELPQRQRRRALLGSLLRSACHQTNSWKLISALKVMMGRKPDGQFRSSHKDLRE
jgi:hypothetical protein